MKRFAICFSALLVCAATSFAQTIQQRDMIAQDKGEVASLAKEANDACGTHINFSVDYSTFSDVKTAPENANQQSPYSFFQNVTDALGMVCGTPAGKAAVQAKLKAVVVTHSKTESETFSNGTFHYAVPYTGATVQTVADFLRSKL
jgi:hypothetical protein